MRCGGILAAGCSRPVVYVWTAEPSGNEVLLCEECCGAWRVVNRAEPGLDPPSRIRSVSPADRL